jgi:serine/threonine protein kinase
MEYVDGENLEHLGIISEESALIYIQKISSALSEVHEKGLLHRDIKPSNILVRTETNEPILVDFGIAREFNEKIIQTHTPFCSDFYAPPEQYNLKAERSASSDIYSLAATLYKILTGKEPEGALSRLLYGCELKSPKQLNPNISDAVEIGILKGLDLQADNRPQSTKEWLEIMELKIITPSEYKISQNTTNLKKAEESIAESEERKRIEGRVKFYISELYAPEPSSRLRAIQELGLLGESASSSVPHLIKIIQNVDDIFCHDVEIALSKIGSPSVVPVSQLLNHEKIEVKRKAASILERIGADASAATPQLILALEDPDPEGDVRWYATIAIGKIGLPAKEAIPSLLKRLRDEKAGIRAYAAWSLGQMRQEAQSAIPSILEKLFEDKSENVFIAGLEALEAIGYDITTININFTDGTVSRNAKEYITIQREEDRKSLESQKMGGGIVTPLRRTLSANTPPQI